MFLDKVLDVFVLAPFFEDNYRLPRNSPGENIAPSIDYIRAVDKDELVIVFTGDSVVSGVNIKENRFTIPYQFRDLLNKKAKVYNLAISGSRLADQYLVIKSVVDSADIVFFNIHYQFFNSKWKPIEHEGLVNLRGVTDADIEKLGLVNKKEKRVLFFLRHSSLGQWTLLRNRQKINQKLFGGSPTEYIKTKYSLKQWEKIKKGHAWEYQAFPEFSDTRKRKIIKNHKKNFDIGSIEEDNVNLAYAKKISELAENSDAVFIAYMNPINPDLLDELEIAEDEYKANVRLIRSILEEGNVYFLDYNFREAQAVSPANYHDADHFVKEGAAEFAMILYDDAVELGVIN